MVPLACIRHSRGYVLFVSLALDSSDMDLGRRRYSRQCAICGGVWLLLVETFHVVTTRARNDLVV